MLDIKNSKEIYDYIDKTALNIISNLKSKSNDEKFETSKTEVLNLIDTFRKNKLNVAIEDLKNSQEWERFTIAFYGETNAGKSTIIETLRIYFQEEEKLKRQSEFKKITKEYEEAKQVLKTKIEYIENYILENNRHKEQLTLDFETKKHDLEEEINQIKSDVLNKKENSIFYKILSFLRIINIIVFFKNKEKVKLENDFTKLKNSTLDKLKIFVDGEIIGDGSSDFTKKSVAYNFEHNNQKFTILDVPGIEGDETVVIDEILSVTKKAHAVFYVTSSPTPPQKGDNNKKGTLEKIKEHLGSQTEVYVIFNKRITNPMQLSKELIGDDEKESLKNVDQQISKILGENYAGLKSISAKISFLALADCLLAESQIYNEQKKFLDKFSVDELVKKANFNNLCKFISDELVVNTKQKIKKSNYNKARGVLLELSGILDIALKNNFEPLYKQIKRELDDASSNLQNTSRRLNNDLESVIQKSLENFERNTRKEIYWYIDSDVSDDSFKNKLEVLLEDNAKKMFEVIPKDIEKQIYKFQHSITEVLENFKRRVAYAIQDYQTFNFGNLDSKFNIDLQIDNGIDKMGLLGSLMGAGGATYWALTAGNIWNPAGWTMATFGIALSAIAVLVSFGKAVWKFFDSDYKKSEQRKAFDENIRRIIDNIKPQLTKEIWSISSKSNALIDKLMDELGNTVKQREMTIEYIKKSQQDLITAVKQIKLEGDR